MANITYYGHSSFGLELNGIHLLFDPFISPNTLAKDVDISKIKADYIIVSHAHQDHIYDVEAIAKRTGATIISNYEVMQHYAQKDIKGHGMNPGGALKLEFGQIKCVTAVHSSSFPDGSYGGNPVGFVIESKDCNLYFAGDTGLTMDMKLIPLICAPLDYAVLPIGDIFTMNAEDAVLASDFIACDKIIACHYDTFEPISVDKVWAKDLFLKRNKELIFLNIGETVDLV